MVSPENPPDRSGAGARKHRGRPRAFHEKTDQNTIKSLDRALIVLAELAHLQSASLSELAHNLDESPATVYRVLITLSLHGMVETDEAAQTWHIGPRAFQIGSVFMRRTSLVERSRPVMRALMEATGETANLGVERGGEVLFLSQVETHAPIRAFFAPGTLSPLHASGIGKVLLAHLPDARVASLCAGALERFTEHTRTSRAAIDADIADIRARGYSIDDQERTIGMRCIAAPIRNAHGEVIAGVSVSGPTSRIGEDRVEAFATAVRHAAATLSAAMGAPSDDQGVPAD